MSSLDKSWVAPSTLKEIERLSQLILHYETVNLDQRRALELAQSSRDHLVQRMQQIEREKVQVSKRMKALDTTLKFERAASDGLRKKLHTLEFDHIQLKNEHEQKSTTLTTLQGQYQTAVKELEEERIVRLRLLHEKEKMQRQAVEWKQTVEQLEHEVESVQSRCLHHLQELETKVELLNYKEGVIKVQSEEIVRLNNEVIKLKDKLLRLNESLLDQQANHVDYHQTIDCMQQELSYLRKHIVTEAKTASEKSLTAYHAPRDTTGNKNNQLVNTLTASRYDVSGFRTSRLFSSRATRDLSDTKEDFHLVTEALSTKTRDHHSIGLEPNHTNESNLFMASSLTHEDSMTCRSPQVEQEHSRAMSALSTAGRPLRAYIMINAPLAASSSCDQTIAIDDLTQQYLDSPERLAMLQRLRSSSRKHKSRSKILPDSISSRGSSNQTARNIR